jgi:hypothetical protein
MAGAIQLFAGCAFVISDLEQKQMRPVTSFGCLSEVWMIVCNVLIKGIAGNRT